MTKTHRGSLYRLTFPAWLAATVISLYGLGALAATGISGTPTGATDALKRSVDDYNTFVEQLRTGKKALENDRDSVLRSIQAAQAKEQALSAKQKAIEAENQKLKTLEADLDKTSLQLKTAAGEFKLLQKNQSGFENFWQWLPGTSVPEEKTRLKSAEEAFDQAKKAQDEQAKRMEAQAKELQKMRSDYDADLKVATEGRQKVEAINSRLSSYDSMASQQIQAKMSTFARDVYDQMKQDSYDAKILLTDFSVLKMKYQLNDQQLEALRQGIDSRLDATLMGQYVNGQIKKAMSGVCELQAQCAAKDSGALKETIDRIVVPRPDKDSRPTQNAGKDAAPARGGAIRQGHPQDRSATVR